MIQTERLLLRELSENDAADVYNLFSNPTVMYFLDLPHPSIEYSREYIRTCPRTHYEFAVVLIDTEEFLGIVELNVEFEPIIDSRADLSYYFLPEFWHKGYATEASRALIRFGFEVLKVNKITSGCLKCNSASENVMIRCDMQKEAEFKQHTRFKGEWVKRVEYAVLKDEYLKRE